MDETLHGTRRRWGGLRRGMSVEVRLLYAACWCFIMAQYVVNERPWDVGFRMVATLALTAAIWMGARERRAQGTSGKSQPSLGG